MRIIGDIRRLEGEAVIAEDLFPASLITDKQSMAEFEGKTNRDLADFKEVKKLAEVMKIDPNHIYFTGKTLSTYYYVNLPIVVDLMNISMLRNNMELAELTMEKIRIGETRIREEVNEGKLETLFAYLPNAFQVMVFNQVYWNLPKEERYEWFQDRYLNLDYGFSAFDPNVVKDAYANMPSERRQMIKRALYRFSNSDTLTIYRGVSAYSTPINKALSWTLDLYTASKFASFYTGEGQIIQAKVKMKHVLDLIVDRHELEVIVQPEHIMEAEDMGMKTTSTELKKFIEYRLYGRYLHFTENFDTNLFKDPSSIHGVQHMKRVLIHALSLGMELDLDDFDTRILALASMWHDIGRTHDYEDTIHGDKGWEKVLKLNLLESADQLDSWVDEPLYDDDIRAIEFLVRHHCRSDKNIKIQLLEVPEQERERVEKLIKVFKDADALDRVRIRDLDPSYLRFEESKKRLCFAWGVLNRVTGKGEDFSINESEIPPADPKTEAGFEGNSDTLTKLNYKEMTLDDMWVLKEAFMNDMKKLDIEKMRKELEVNRSGEYVTLYHGTSSVHLNSILEKGILPREEVGINNWEHKTHSMEKFTYLTNKWHYFYATNASMEYLTKKYGVGKYMEHINEVFPAYIEVRVPKEYLFMDEDAFISKFMLQKVKSALKKGEDVTYDWSECLAQYGTAGVLGAIPKEWIVSFTVLGDFSMYSYVLDEKSQYFKDYTNWQLGKGKGKLKLKDLLEREKQSDLNGTWWVRDLKGATIESIGLNPETNRISLSLFNK